ncbi:DUF881 domain-containing protein [Nocardioides terrisoli]|uniref:DUF881 domain-containing protein n=1 Tax=Nocardioides terrisoli TaxID=3388267 RepID=UPI00287BA565|nr:DUF881 domain-containing protein [Nocardioides marmorisolisilvae]
MTDPTSQRADVRPGETGEGAVRLHDSPATMGLLPYLTAHALDDGYAEVSARTRGTPPRRSTAVWTILALAAFVVLLLMAASQTSSNAATDQRERSDLIHQIQARKAAVASQGRLLDRLRTQVNQLRARAVDNGKLSSGTRDQLQRLSVLSGTVPVRGPGVEVRVDDAPDAPTERDKVLDTDLQQLVNGLWQAGAEAIAINGQRLTNLSAIMEAGSAITVNFQSLDRPYVVRAVGDPAALPARFAETAGGATWLDLHQQLGLQFNIRAQTSMTLPAAEQPALHFARSAEGRAS